MEPADPAGMRRDYGGWSLEPEELAPDPMTQFGAWFVEACDADVLEPNAMTLATADRAGAPSARTVLLKGHGPGGFTFFTNYESRKGRELSENPRAALVFLWLPMSRQVTARGIVSRISADESDAYFRSRPAGSRVSAAASPQSRVVPDRAALEALRDAVEKRGGADGPARPDHWGGLRLAPDEVEFWEGQGDRFHDRIVYRPEGSGWRRQRLAP
jgi:pyridoxamine 5'-phosphate oxidase